MLPCRPGSTLLGARGTARPATCGPQAKAGWGERGAAPPGSGAEPQGTPHPTPVTGGWVGEPPGVWGGAPGGPELFDPAHTGGPVGNPRGPAPAQGVPGAVAPGHKDAGWRLPGPPPRTRPRPEAIRGGPRPGQTRVRGERRRTLRTQNRPRPGQTRARRTGARVPGTAPAGVRAPYPEPPPRTPHGKAAVPKKGTPCSTT
ncbi:hypothetical protein GCM10010388_43190 [Streptomyces mauvecolor]